MTSEQTDALINAIQRLSHGGTNGPTGMEAIAMALCGNQGLGDMAVGPGLFAVAGAIEELKDSIEESTDRIVEVINSLKTINVNL